MRSIAISLFATGLSVLACSAGEIQDQQQANELRTRTSRPWFWGGPSPFAGAAGTVSTVGTGGAAQGGASAGGAGAAQTLGGSVGVGSATQGTGGAAVSTGGLPAVAAGGSAGQGVVVSTGGVAEAVSRGGASGGSLAVGTPGRGGMTGSGGAGKGGSTAAGGAPTGTGICGAQEGQLFDSSFPWNQTIDQSALDSESATIINWLQANHTESGRFQIDGPSDEVDNQYGITILKADSSTPRQAFTPTGDFYSPDCDTAPPPLPVGGAIEAESSYACNGDGDCHLIVIDTASCRLYELWRANAMSSTKFESGCEAVWDLKSTYNQALRGECCTSADAAGLPIAAQMFTADEIAAGEIKHAIRFILPNQRMRQRAYVRPATHSVPATSGPSGAPPYGSRMRLKASFNESSLSPGAQVVARALKKYGMILSDGGNLTFVAANDRFTQHKWRDVHLSPSDLKGLNWTDFEVPELGARRMFDATCDCSRTPISQ
jgi:hypothetical protein